VERLEPSSTGQAEQVVKLRLSDGRTVEARNVVIAAGAWSHLLAKQLGDAIPLETERG
jgi:D-amino-acid dehydrogenase